MGFLWGSRASDGFEIAPTGRHARHVMAHDTGGNYHRYVNRGFRGPLFLRS
jgi:hypothetical protein